MIIPTRSLPNLSIILEIICFDFSSLFGAMSSANILLDTSSAKTTSTPSLFTVFSLVPILGLTKARIKNEIPIKKNESLRMDLKTEILGASLDNNPEDANFF